MKKRPLPKCGAKTQTGEPCKLTAGHGTDHFGEGRCKFHGGKTPDRVKFKEKNKAAEKHGFYTKHLPEETLELFDEMELCPIDMQWDVVRLQYMAIMRAQKLMYVKDQEDHARFKTAMSTGVTDSETHEIQAAWDRQEQFLSAQSRAITAFNRTVKQYEEMLLSDLATEEQKERVNLLKARVEILTGANEEYEDMSDALEDVYG